jgi:hypothetical protein
MALPIENAFGPAFLLPRHHRERAVAAPRERRISVHVSSHQQDVRILVANLEAGQKTDVREPRVAQNVGDSTKAETTSRPVSRMPFSKVACACALARRWVFPAHRAA